MKSKELAQVVKERINSTKKELIQKSIYPDVVSFNDWINHIHTEVEKNLKKIW